MDNMTNQAPVEEQVIPGNEQSSEQIEGNLVNDGNVELGPGQQAQLDAYTDNATLAVFSEESQPAILQQLQAEQEPVNNVAKTAFVVHKQLESGLQKNGEKMSEITMALGAAHLVSELVVLADAAGLYKLDDTQSSQAYQNAIMKYFETGLKDGSINPVELQKTIEPLMNDQQREYGIQQMEQSGISKTAPPPNMGQMKQKGILGGA